MAVDALLAILLLSAASASAGVTTSQHYCGALVPFCERAKAAVAFGLLAAFAQLACVAWSTQAQLHHYRRNVRPQTVTLAEPLPEVTQK